MAEEGDNGEYFNPEEEVQINPTNNLNLAKVEVKTGEEDEDLIFKSRGKLFRFRDGEWKERGTGDLKLLRHKTEKKIRFILRQDKTLKIVANFIISEKPLCELKPHQGSEKMFMFMAYDCSEEPVMEKFVIKLGNADKAKVFKKHFEDAQTFNQLVKEGKEKELVWAPVFKDTEAENKKTDASKDEKKEDKKEDKKEEKKDDKKEEKKEEK
jgi:hypothetical protein